MARHLRTIAGVVVIIACAGGVARATEVGYSRKYGLGAVVGDPTGLSGKVWVGRRTRSTRASASTATGSAAAAFAIATGARSAIGATAAAAPACTSTICGSRSWSTEGKGAARLAHRRGRARVLPRRSVRLRLLGRRRARAVGLDLTFNQPSFLEVFVEIAPVFYVAPATFLALEGGLGVRGYF